MLNTFLLQTIHLVYMLSIKLNFPNHQYEATWAFISLKAYSYGKRRNWKSYQIFARLFTSYIHSPFENHGRLRHVFISPWSSPSLFGVLEFKWSLSRIYTRLFAAITMCTRWVCSHGNWNSFSSESHKKLPISTEHQYGWKKGESTETEHGLVSNLGAVLQHEYMDAGRVGELEIHVLVYCVCWTSRKIKHKKISIYTVFISFHVDHVKQIE